MTLDPVLVLRLAAFAVAMATGCAAPDFDDAVTTPMRDARVRAPDVQPSPDATVAPDADPSPDATVFAPDASTRPDGGTTTSTRSQRVRGAGLGFGGGTTSGSLHRITGDLGAPISTGRASGVNHTITGGVRYPSTP